MSLIHLQNNIRDLRDGDWYWLDRRVLRLYARRLGPSGIAVYNALASFADSEGQECYPTRKAIAHMLGLSRRTVSRKLRLLEELGLVSVEKTKSSYRYLLLEPPAEAAAQTTPRVTPEAPGGDKGSTSEGTRESTNNNHLTRNIYNIAAAGGNFSPSSFKPQTREELLALDLAQALGDLRNLSLYLSYARQYPESLLRMLLGRVKEVPQEKIRTSRAAFFRHLVRRYAGGGAQA